MFQYKVVVLEYKCLTTLGLIFFNKDRIKGSDASLHNAKQTSPGKEIIFVISTDIWSKSSK